MTPADDQKANSNGRLRHLLDQVEREERVALQIITRFRNQRAMDRQTLQQTEAVANQVYQAFCGAISRGEPGTGPGSMDRAHAVNTLTQVQLETYRFLVPVRDRLYEAAIEAVRVQQVRRSEEVLRQIREDNSA